MAPLTSSAVPNSNSNTRSRPQARRKPNDDAAYFGPSTGVAVTVAGTKRHASTMDGESMRVKRKMVEGVENTRGSLVKFGNLPISVIYRYLTQFDLVPHVYPSPLTVEDPPAPLSLENESRHSPTPSIQTTTTTAANRPRREQSRRRSSRLAEEVRGRTPILTDVDEVHRVLAGIAEKHFREEIGKREELDVLTSFMCKIKNK